MTPVGGPVVFDEDDGVAVSEGDPVSVPCGVDDVSGQGMGDQEVDSPETDSPVGADSDLASPLLGEAPRVRVPRPSGLLGGRWASVEVPGDRWGQAGVVGPGLGVWHPRPAGE